MKFVDYADRGQTSLDTLFHSDDPRQFMNNIYPLESEEQNRVFNYWWIAHLVDTRVDGYLRTQSHAYRDGAVAAYHYNKKRNYNSLIHEYYDDMLWNALAGLRLYEVTGLTACLDDAKAVCADLFDTAFNLTAGGGYAWKRSQINYKNTPVNGPLMILALRLYQLDPKPEYLKNSLDILHWLYFTLVDPETEFVNDGINSRNTMAVDPWAFTYNQGTYIGALVEFYNVTKDQRYLDHALKCAHTAIDRLGATGILLDDGDGGDIGLFKGILYRYLVLLYKATHETFISDFITKAVKVLVENDFEGETLMADRNWQPYQPGKAIPLSDEIGAVMSLEAATALERYNQ
ncbi:glycoside hydrolase family 76 protein [Lacticaseibacillus parakribbianus]|uniref:glycoside hydrolase family 76 protein n=1 Tax=Lacticaseibacillus parakribbianus TaxID=2970927 RepID=UPI0021CB862A|nr:glycoside hydrolase family 76 protein [Lacticaseibacillus parakribbianus]